MPERCNAALSYEQSIRERLNKTGESIGNEFSRLAQKAGIFRAKYPVRLPSQLLNCSDYDMRLWDGLRI
jgi:hypothetical protein